MMGAIVNFWWLPSRNEINITLNTYLYVASLKNLLKETQWDKNHSKWRINSLLEFEMSDFFQKSLS